MRASLISKAVLRQDEELFISTSTMLWVGRGNRFRRNEEFEM